MYVCVSFARTQGDEELGGGGGATKGRPRTRNQLIPTFVSCRCGPTTYSSRCRGPEAGLRGWGVPRLLAGRGEVTDTATKGDNQDQMKTPPTRKERERKPPERVLLPRMLMKAQNMQCTALFPQCSRANSRRVIAEANNNINSGFRRESRQIDTSDMTPLPPSSLVQNTWARHPRTCCPRPPGHQAAALAADDFGGRLGLHGDGTRGRHPKQRGEHA